MRKVLFFICMFAAGAGPLWAQKTGDYGAGVILGNPTGGTAKLWLNENQALDAGLGFSTDFALYGDYLWHGWKVLPQPAEGRLPVYLGLGAQIRTVSPEEFGLRTVVGIAYWLPRNPVEIFFELAPVFRLTPGKSIGLDAGIGLRYYFLGR
ncbi:MAG: hypothetical protein WCU88_00825 [Elusimicrobiota bacterium]|jgi:hypothetical protein